jgi:hypothetical protein
MISSAPSADSTLRSASARKAICTPLPTTKNRISTGIQGRRRARRADRASVDRAGGGHPGARG